MEIRPIPKDVQCALRSGSNLATISHCVVELIFNAIDADAENIGVSVHLEAFKFQVIDDGIGLTKTNLDQIGSRYVSGKCHNLNDYNTSTKYYGFRGETLANLIDICESVLIHTRAKNSTESYSKHFLNKSSSGTERGVARPSCGTTISVNGWMKTIPVRQKQLNEVCDLIEIKNQIEKIALIHPNISFSLRNTRTKKVVISIKQRNSVLTAIHSFVGNGVIEHFKYVHFEQRCYKINGYVGVKAISKPDVQFVYLNRRYVRKSRIHKYLRSIFLISKILNDNDSEAHPMYFMCIECPYSKFDMITQPHNTKIVFKDWHQILKYLETVVIQLLTVENLLDIPKKLDKSHELSVAPGSGIGISQFDTVLKGNVVKRIDTSNQIVKTPENIIDKSLKSTHSGNKHNESSIIVKKHIDYRQQFFDNLELSVNSDHISKTDIEIFKTPTVPAPRSKSKLSKAIQYDFNDLADLRSKDTFCQRESIFRSTAETFNSHKQLEKKLIENRRKKQTTTMSKCSENQAYSKNISYQAITPRTKVLSWLNFSPNEFNSEPTVHEMEYQTPELENRQEYNSERHATIETANSNLTNCTLHLEEKQKIYFKRKYDKKNRHNDEPRKKMKTHIGSTRCIQAVSNSSTGGTIQRNVYSKQYKDQKFVLSTKNSITEFIEKTPSQVKNTAFEFEFKKITKHTVDYSVEIPMTNDEAGFRLNTPKLNITTDQIAVDPPKKMFSDNRVISLTTPMNCNQIMQVNTPYLAHAERHHEWDLKMTPFPTEMQTNLFEGTPFASKEYSSLNMGTCIKGLINKLTTDKSTITSKSKKLNKSVTEANSGNNPLPDMANNSSKSFIMNKYFDQYAENTQCNVDLEDNPKKGNYDSISIIDVSRGEFDKGIKAGNVITSTVKSYCVNGAEPSFKLQKRLDFIPKGMSQIVDENKCICRYLTPNTKSDVMKKIRKNYEDNLNLDHRAGFNFEKKFTIRKIQIAMSKKSKIFRPQSFSKDIFNGLKVLNQVDKKFIVTLLEPTFTENGVLILFDQHAVHERIRLENLLKDYEKLPGILKATKLEDNLEIQIDCHKVEVMRKFQWNFEKHGLIYDIIDDSVNITSIPTYVFNKSVREKNTNRNTITTIITSLINEIIAFSLETKGAINFIPQTMLTIINSEACRGATKFGDELSKEECELYMKQLSSCSLPFQCAHGRPTLVPIFEINKLE